MFSLLRRSLLPVTGLGLLALVAAIVATPSAGAASRNPRVHLTNRLSHKARHAAGAQSLNWSGYVKSGSHIESAAASWHVPTLDTAYPGYSSTWVGIDGATSGDQYLIQTGTEGDVIDGHAEYHAWWEVITPTDEAPETLFGTLTVHAGDSIRATVAKTHSGAWKMSLRDSTTKKTVSHTTAFDGPGKSAEWIQEDTDVDGYISAAPNWQKVKFTSLRVNNKAPGLKASQAENIVDSQGTQEDSTGSPNKARDGFTITWLATGTRSYLG